MNIRAADFVKNLRGLSVSEKAVAYSVAAHADKDTAIATMSMKLLAREAGLKRRETASLRIKQLVTWGIISPVNGISKGGSTHTTAYKFTFTIKPGYSGVYSTSAEAERSQTKLDAQCGTPPIINCDSPGTVSSVTPSAHLASVSPSAHKGGAPSCYSQRTLELEGNAVTIGGTAIEGAAAPAVPAAPETKSSPAPAEEAGPAPTSSFHPTGVVVGGTTAFSDLGGKKSDGEMQATPSGEETLEDRSYRIEAVARMRQLDSKMSDAAITREYKKKFDQTNEKFSLNLEWFPPNANQRRYAARYFREYGSDVALPKWEVYLRRDDHEVTQPEEYYDENTKTMKTGARTEQVKWLLYFFVQEETGWEMERR